MSDDQLDLDSPVHVSHEVIEEEPEKIEKPVKPARGSKRGGLLVRCENDRNASITTPAGVRLKPGEEDWAPKEWALSMVNKHLATLVDAE